MKRATQATVEKHTNMIGGKFSGKASILTPTGMGLELLPAKNLSQEAKGGVNDLAVGGQPQTILARPVGAVWVVVGRNAQDGATVPVAPVLLPALRIKAAVR